MGPVVRRGDDEWFTIVRWVLFALIRAGETGITQSNVRSRLEADTDPLARRWIELDGTIFQALAIPPGWATRVLESVQKGWRGKTMVFSTVSSGLNSRYRADRILPEPAFGEAKLSSKEPAEEETRGLGQSFDAKDSVCTQRESTSLRDMRAAP
jgi:hypothetical protein